MSVFIAAPNVGVFGGNTMHARCREPVRERRPMSATDQLPEPHVGRASTTSPSSPPTWTPPCGSTSACSACASSPRRWPGRCATTSSRWAAGNTVAFFEVARRGDVREARRRSERPGHPARPHLVRRARRAHARDAAQAAARGRVRGDHGGRPRVHPIGLLHRPERHRARSVVVGRRRHRSAVRLHRRSLFGDPDPVPAVAELQAGGLADLPTTHLT